MLKNGNQTKFFSKNFGNSKNGCTFAKFSARKKARIRKRSQDIEIITIDEVVQESLKMISVNSTKAFKPSSGWEDSSRVGYREGKIDLKKFVLLFLKK